MRKETVCYLKQFKVFFSIFLLPHTQTQYNQKKNKFDFRLFYDGFF